MKVRFIESPTGVFGLGYFVGDEVNIEEKKARLLVEGGFAEAITPMGKDEPEQPKVEPVEKKKPGRKGSK
jgi:hypothetical protein